ncbi:hypothetical protein EV401DRAFT_1068473 [Pisolithus croceorrhizus]|nr:hypothetical protein EV401DRAFT_1068473 [Pisolithus croceorrhizus]
MFYLRVASGGAIADAAFPSRGVAVLPLPKGPYKTTHGFIISDRIVSYGGTIPPWCAPGCVGREVHTSLVAPNRPARGMNELIAMTVRQLSPPISCKSSFQLLNGSRTTHPSRRMIVVSGNLTSTTLPRTNQLDFTAHIYDTVLIFEVVGGVTAVNRLQAFRALWMREKA